jgi:hypothetical protein
MSRLSDRKENDRGRRRREKNWKVIFEHRSAKLIVINDNYIGMYHLTKPVVASVAAH